MENPLLETAAARWSRPATGTHWWQNPAIVGHVNRLVCGQPAQGVVGGDLGVLGNRRYRRAVSVGCGAASKEMALLQAGVVERFELFEISATRVEQGAAAAEARNLGDRVTWHREPPDFHRPVSVDLAYWNSSLHHMLDTEQAIWWSRKSARAFFMNDYVGPNRFQWPDEMLDVANRIRALLRAPPLVRPDADALAADDPTESADSEAILPALSRYFPEAEVRLTGGVVYHLALKGLSPPEGTLLEGLLLIDQYLAETGLTHFAVAHSLGQESHGSAPPSAGSDRNRT